MGTKPGKHAGEPEDEGREGDETQGPSYPSVSGPVKEVDQPKVKTSKGGGGADQSEIPPSLSPKRSDSEKENLLEMSSQEKPSKHKKHKSKENVEKVILASSHTPVKMEPQKELEPLTPLVINENQDISIRQHKPRGTSTPAAALSPDSGTDQSDDEAFSPNDPQFPSPSVSFQSNSTMNSSIRPSSHSDSLDSRRSEPNFGRFYNTSYLGLSAGRGGYMKKPQTKSESNEKMKSFHRPPNFTYQKDPPEFLKKKNSGMAALASVKRVVKVRRSSSPADVRNLEAVRMSVFPSAKPKEPNEPEKIERDDWPGPASPAAILPEILRQRKRSKGEKDEEEEEEHVSEDPRIKRELEEISKIKDESGIGRVIYKELEELKVKPQQPLDPWKSSRAPSAKFEPRYRTRFQSPMFASPSRFLDRPRYAWDDSDMRTYRSVSTLANLPTPKPGYGPSYLAPRAATLPLSGAYGARDFMYLDFTDTDGKQRSAHNSSSTLTGDTSSRRYDSSYSGYEGPNISLLQLQKSTWHTEAEPTLYPYDKLKITNFDLPKEVDTNHLEIHLENKDFEDLFKMSRENFYRMAEWKRNDLKRKVHLY